MLYIFYIYIYILFFLPFYEKMLYFSCGKEDQFLEPLKKRLLGASFFDNYLR